MESEGYYTHGLPHDGKRKRRISVLDTDGYAKISAVCNTKVSLAKRVTAVDITAAFQYEFRRAEEILTLMM